MTPAEAFARLKELRPDYDKADVGCMDDLVLRVETAIKNAKRANSDALKTGGRNPSSSMPDLVKVLLELP